MFFSNAICQDQLSAKDMHRQLGLQVPLEYYEKHKVDLNKYQDYKELGLDLKRERKSTYLENSLFVDHIIRGKVVKKYYDTDKSSVFRTFLKVEVERSVKGDVKDKFITICLRSGSLGNGVYAKLSHETSAELGEEGLFYLKEPNESDLQFENKFRKEKKVLNLNKSFHRPFIIENRYKVANGFIFDNDEFIRIDDCLDRLEKIIELSN